MWETILIYKLSSLSFSFSEYCLFDRGDGTQVIPVLWHVNWNLQRVLDFFPMPFIGRTLTTKLFIKNTINYMCGFTYYSFLKFLAEPWLVHLVGAFWKKWFSSIIPHLSFTYLKWWKGVALSSKPPSTSNCLALGNSFLALQGR